MMTNEERLLHALYGIKKVLNDFGLEDIKNEVQFKNGNTETIDCISVLQEFVVNYVNSTQPYKFEDLKPNMWVWDDEYKSYLKIIGFDKIKGLDLSIYVSSGVGIYKHDFYIEFKENCLYPVTKVMQYQNNK